MKRCQNCQKILDKKEPPTMDEACPYCGAALHVCFNCRHYSPQAPHQCLKNGLPAIQNKRAANTCAGFHMRVFQDQFKTPGQEAAKNKWDDLFNL